MADITADTRDPKDTSVDYTQDAPDSIAPHGSTPDLQQLTLDIDGLAALLHVSRNTVLTDRSRNPHRLPPAYRRPGTREPLWLLDESLDWLRGHPEQRTNPQRTKDESSPPARPPGRPRKTDSVRRSRGGA